MMNTVVVSGPVRFVEDQIKATPRAVGCHVDVDAGDVDAGVDAGCRRRCRCVMYDGG